LFDNAQDVALKSGDVYLVGSTVGAFPGHSNAGLQDAFVMRIRADGLPDEHEHDDEGDE